MRPYKSSSKWYVTAIYTGLQELVLISYELRHASSRSSELIRTDMQFVVLSVCAIFLLMA